MTIFVRNENNNKFFSEFSAKLNEAERNLENSSIHYESFSKNPGFEVNNLGEDFAVKCEDVNFVVRSRLAADQLLRCAQKQVDSWTWGILIGESNLEYVQELEAALQVCQKVERISKNVLAKHMNYLQRANLQSANLPKSNCAFNLAKTTKKFGQTKKMLVENALYSFYCPLRGHVAEVPKPDLFINEPFFLHTAIKNSGRRVAQNLIKLGLNPDIADKNGDTPLLLACKNQLEDVAIELLKKGANKNHADNSGNTPFILACKNKMFSVIEKLLEMGIDVMCANNLGETGLHCAYQIANEHDALQTMIKMHFREIFAQSDVMRLRLQQSRLFDIPNYFIQRPQLLVQEAKQNKINPLEVAFFFFDIKLARELAPHLGRTGYKNCLDALSNKYPATSPLIMKFNLLAHYEINPEHLKTVKTAVLPAKAEGIEVRALLSIFNNLNLFDPTAANYVNPINIVTSPTITQEDLQNGLLRLIDHVEKKVAYSGTPDPGAALNDFYASIEAALTNVIKKLQSLEDTQDNTLLKAKTLCFLCEAGRECGGRIFAESIQQYERVVMGRSPNFEDAIADGLAEQRLTLVSSELLPNRNVHFYNLYMHLFGKELGLPFADTYANFKDRFTDGIIVDIHAAKRRFFKHYTPYTIVHDQVWPSLSAANAWVLRNKFIKWWKNNTPKQWAEEKYNFLKRRLNVLKQCNVSDTEIAYIFERDFQIVSKNLSGDLQPKESMKLAKKLNWKPHPLDTQLYFTKQRFQEFKDANVSDKVKAIFLESHDILVGNNQTFEDAIKTHQPEMALSNTLRLYSVERGLEELEKCNLSNDLLKSYLYSHNIPVSQKECPNNDTLEKRRKRDFIRREVHIGESINKNAVISMLEKQGVLTPALNYGSQRNNGAMLGQAPGNSDSPFFFNS